MEIKKTLEEKLLDVQAALKAPKSQYNSFGKYSYRNAEDIVEAVKPLAKANRILLTVSDDIVAVGSRIYIKATARVSDIDNPERSVSCDAFAREPDAKKGMDDSQITGAASSYARKYALNGLFAIDDTKDADTNNRCAKEPNAPDQNPVGSSVPIGGYPVGGGDRVINRESVVTTAESSVYCADCGKLISSTPTKSVADIVKFGNGKFGRVLCAACMKRVQEVRK